LAMALGQHRARHIFMLITSVRKNITKRGCGRPADNFYPASVIWPLWLSGTRGQQLQRSQVRFAKNTRNRQQKTTSAWTVLNTAAAAATERRLELIGWWRTKRLCWV